MNYIKISSKDNPAVKNTRALNMEKERGRTGLFIIEGNRLVRDAIKSGVKIKHAFIDENNTDKDLISDLEHLCEEIYFVSSALTRYLSGVEAPQGVLCSAYIPECTCKADILCRRYVAVESMRDPGNLGTVLRTAEAFGFSCILSGDSCGAYSPKVVRASMGAVFRIPLFIPDSFEDELINIKNRGCKLYAAMPGDNSVNIKDLKKDIKADESLLVVIGNEARGISERTARLCTHIHIPMCGGAESLNAAAAAAIILWEASDK